MVKAKNSLLVVQSTLENITKEKREVVAYFHLTMEGSTKEKCFIICFMGTDISNGLMAGSIKENGTRIKCREMAFILGQMVKSTLGNTSKIRNTGMGFSTTLTIKSTLENGTRVSNKELEK